MRVVDCAAHLDQQPNAITRRLHEPRHLVRHTKASTNFIVKKWLPSKALTS